MTSHSESKAGGDIALQDALEREAATREILQVISRSRDDDGPVFDVILANAARLCNASMARLHLVDDKRTLFRLAAAWGERLRSIQIGDEYPLDGTLLVAQTILGSRTIHVADLAEIQLYLDRNPVAVRLVEEEGIRTRLTVPLISGDAALGCITLSRREVRPFADADIALVETFAAQAVIAIENVRQFRELQTRLEREAATREILQVISRSRDDEQPVFDVILENARRLCQATMAAFVLGREGGGHQVMAAHRGATEETVELYRAGRFPMDPEVSLAAQAIIERRAIHLEDMADTQGYRDRHPNFVSLVDQQGIRTNLLVPLVSRGEGIGCLILFRQEVRPYTPDQIALVETFARQAVIAIENVRQFRELQTRLEREAATRQILEVISRSRADESPVFDVILESASRLCHAPLALLSMANEVRTHVRIVAHRGARPEFVASFAEFNEPIEGSDLIAVRPVSEGTVIRIDNIADSDLYRNRNRWRVSMVELEGIRSVLVVPLLRDSQGIGAIILYRREVSPFSDDDVALVEGFAAQAVIAVENVRQFRAIQAANAELESRLEREAATGEVLGVISQFRNDETPVFESILENAARLCHAPHAFLQLRNEANTHLQVAAQNFAASKFLDLLRANPIPTRNNPGSISVRGMNKSTPTQYDDVRLLKGTELYTTQLGYAIDAEGMRTALFVPLIAEGENIGVFVLYKLEVAPFTDDEISLVQTFAAQAVIAIENVKQFKALESLNASLESRVQSQVGEIERMGRLKRFLSPAVADAVVHSGDEKMLGSHRALIAVLFCDIRGFTAFCETAEPEETIEVLQTYHEEMGRLIHAHGAGVDHRAGDGIMVIFNDPLPCDDPAGDALRMALAMRERMVELCKGWRRLGHRLGFGVGISLGYATVGMVGSEGRYDYTASGTAVNLAARLCDEAEDGEILLSPRAFAAVEEDFAAESKGEISLKGISAPVEIFRITEAGAASG